MPSANVSTTVASAARAATVASGTWTTVFGGYNSSTQIYTKRSTTDACGFVPATAASTFAMPTNLKAGQPLTIVGQLVKSDGTTAPVGTCPNQILNVTSLTGAAPTPSPSVAPSVAPSPSPTPVAPTSTYWVATTGSDSNNGTSQATAFRTIQHAQDVVAPGQTVTVRDGTYTDCGNCVGVNYNVLFKHGGTSAAARITYKAEHRGAAIIDGGGNLARHCFGFNDNLAWITIDGFHIQHCEGGIAGLGNAHDVRISHNEIDHMGTTGNCGTNGGQGYVGISWNEAFNITVDGNIIHDIGEAHNSHACSFTNDHGIYAHGHDNTIVNNVFYNNNSGWDIQLAGGPSGQNWLIANNTFGARNDPNAPGNVVIWSNSATTPHNITFENNISGSGVVGGLLNCLFGSDTSNLVAKNNLVAANVPLIAGSCGVTSTNNRFNTDPLFVSAAADNFRLQSGSPALGAGAFNALVLDDFDGGARPNPPSLGAF